MNDIAQLFLVLVLLLNLYMLGVSRLTACIRIVGLQGVLLGALPLLMPDAELNVHSAALSIGSLVVKGVVIPSLLFRAVRDIRVGREIEPYIGFTTSLALGMVVVVAAFWLSSTSRLPNPAQCPLIVPVSIAAVITGLLILVSRRKAVTQVIGYIVLENGVYIFGLSLAAKMPFLVEMGIMLDVLGGVFVMGFAIDRIREVFDDMDVERLAELKDS